MDYQYKNDVNNTFMLSLLIELIIANARNTLNQLNLSSKMLGKYENQSIKIDTMCYGGSLDFTDEFDDMEFTISDRHGLKYIIGFPMFRRLYKNENNPKNVSKILRECIEWHHMRRLLRYGSPRKCTGVGSIYNRTIY